MVAKVVASVVAVAAVAAAIVAKAPAAVAPKTADPAANADQVVVQPKPPETAAVVAALEPKPLVAVANQKQNADPAKTLAAAPKVPPARWRRCFQPVLRAGREATVYIQKRQGNGAVDKQPSSRLAFRFFRVFRGC